MQIGDTRQYTDTTESDSPAKVSCPLCKVSSVPRGIASTRRVYASGQKEEPTGMASCPNCGHVYNRNKTNPAE